MPAAVTREGLLAVAEKEYAALRHLIGPIPADQALRKRDEDTSIKDVIAHRAHWVMLFLGWQAEGAAGGTPAIPAPGYKWSELKRYNADLRARQAGLGWEDAKAAHATAHAALLGFLRSQDDAALYGGPMPGGGNAWTTGRWAEAAGPSHDRSAAKWIRGCLRDDMQDG